MRVDAFDPEPAKDAVALQITDARFFLTYYEPFVTALDAGQRVEAPDGYLTSSFIGGALRVGLRSELYDAVKSGEVSPASDVGELERSDRVQRVRADGTIVEADFGDAFTLDDYDK